VRGVELVESEELGENSGPGIFLFPTKVWKETHFFFHSPFSIPFPLRGINFGEGYSPKWVLLKGFFTSGVKGEKHPWGVPRGRNFVEGPIVVRVKKSLVERQILGSKRGGKHKKGG